VRIANPRPDLGRGKEERLDDRLLPGDRTRLVVEGVGPTPVILETAARREFHAGEDVHLSIDPDALVTLDR